MVSIALRCIQEIGDMDVEDASDMLDKYARAMHATTPESDIWLESIRSSVKSGSAAEMVGTLGLETVYRRGLCFFLRHLAV